MRKKELESQVAELREAVRSQEVTFAIREATWKQEHYNGLSQGGWTSLDSHATKRNRTYDDVKANLEDAFAAWCVNPFAKSYCDYIRFFVIGQGTTVTTDDGDSAQSKIDMFLDANNWEVLEKDVTTELARDGEIFLRFHSTNKYQIKADISLVSLIDPLEIIDIRVDDRGEPDSYLRRYQIPGSAIPEEEKIPAEEIHHIRLNASHNELRGRSDLLSALPWLKMHRAWLVDMARRNYYAGAINWDVEVSGGIKPADVANKYSAGPMPGTVIVHGENEKWAVNAPDMKYSDATAGARALKLMICALFKMPESWFGDTGESNLATTKALAMPTLKAFTDRQDFLQTHFEQVISRGSGVEDVTVSFPELAADEANAKAQALHQLSQAITNLLASGLISKETAYSMLKGYDEDLPEWDDVKKGIEDDDAESVAAIAAGTSAGRLRRPGLEEEGAPVQPSVPPPVPPAA